MRALEGARKASSVILVTGATGNVGRQVVLQLLDANHRVRALVRDPDRADFPSGAAAVRGDFSAPETWDAALDSVEAVFVMWPSPSVDVVGFIDRAARRAKRVVFLSSSLVRDDDPPVNFLAKAHADIEQAIQRSSLAWTILRPGYFASNALRWWAPQLTGGDVLRWPFAGARYAPIHERDIANVAVHGLTDARHDGQKYVLTGPQPLTFAEQIDAIGTATKRPLRFDEISKDAARALFAELRFPLPPNVIDMILDSWERGMTETPLVTDDVARVTGAPAHSFADWAIDHADDFRLLRQTSGLSSPSPTR
jgi:uncharacterized protein YbjT (DUF2867 family)